MLDYSNKILLAWSEAVSGNNKIRDWLTTNGYPELGIFCYALRNKDSARKWLLENGFPHLMAFINGAEGNGQAIDWLNLHGFSDLAKMALAADNDAAAMTHVEANFSREMILLTHKIRFVKNRIDAENEDVHKFSKD